MKTPVRTTKSVPRTQCVSRTSALALLVLFTRMAFAVSIFYKERDTGHKFELHLLGLSSERHTFCEREFELYERR